MLMVLLFALSDESLHYIVGASIVGFGLVTCAHIYAKRAEEHL